MLYLKSPSIFSSELSTHYSDILERVRGSRILVIGAAGTIGQSVVLRTLSFSPAAICCIDISENNLVELTRRVRSTTWPNNFHFECFAIDVNSIEYDFFIRSSKPFDYILNLSALKHVRSEQDPYTLMRMIEVNILNTIKTLNNAKSFRSNKYFCVSTDKATDPINMMGASKRIMELFLFNNASDVNISTARFANVLFSDGSLLHGFNQRFLSLQPLTAPKKISRYFISQEDSSILCILSCMLGRSLEIFIPRSNLLSPTKFENLAIEYIESKGFEPFFCKTEEEARVNAANLIAKKFWPIYLFESDTTGEKDLEIFKSDNELLVKKRFNDIDIIKICSTTPAESLTQFLKNIASMRSSGTWSRETLINEFKFLLPNFNHSEKGKFLNERM